MVLLNGSLACGIYLFILKILCADGGMFAMLKDPLALEVQNYQLYVLNRRLIVFVLFFYVRKEISSCKLKENAFALP